MAEVKTGSHLQFVEVDDEGDEDLSVFVQLITGVYHLPIETLVLMPSFACTFLGRNFYQELLILKDVATIKALNLQKPIFDVLLEVPWLVVSILTFVVVSSEILQNI